MKHFIRTPKTLDELKAMYRKLCMQHHPDRGGDTATMQEINDEHDRLFEQLKKQHNDTHDEQHQTTETAEEFRDILNVLFRLDGLEIELCGCWLWIGGNTREHKDALKAAGCRWSQSKKLWYWRHAEDGSRYHRGRSTIGEIRSKYGSQMLHADGTETNYEAIGATA